ncbi:hypothetical protein D8Y24_05430 [Agrococcus lahaulensis]|nr:hypothetical protein D8Y24_05430 [Agrococcus lahaulensis]
MILAAAVAVLVIALLLTVRPWESSNPPLTSDESTDSAVSPTALPPLVDESTHILDDAGPDAPVVVEFLDFECEVCGAVYPVMEELREEYDGEVTFAVRYFPLPGHFNSGNAAVAVEAAAQQGAFEAMYQRMFETQSEWGEGESPRPTVSAIDASDATLRQVAGGGPHRLAARNRRSAIGLRQACV